MTGLGREADPTVKTTRKNKYNPKDSGYGGLYGNDRQEPDKRRDYDFSGFNMGKRSQSTHDVLFKKKYDAA